MPRYQGPDRDFGQHDDYEVGDEVWTYDATAETVTAVEQFFGDRGYRLSGGRTYDGSRLALLKRAADADKAEAARRLLGR